MNAILKSTLSTIAILGYTFIAFESAKTMPINPCTLRELCSESELIAVAMIGPTERLAYDSSAYSKGLYCFDDARTVLFVSQIIKGTLKNDTIYCYHNSGSVICPASAEFPIGATILAFLDERKRPQFEGAAINSYCWPEGYGNRHYITHALSYGVKVLTDIGLKTYLNRVAGILEIEKQVGYRKHDLPLIEWLVKCAEDTLTRWDGIYDLRFKNPLRAKVQTGENNGVSIELSTKQVQRLYEAVLRSHIFSWQEFWMLELSQDVMDKRLMPKILQFLGDRRYYPYNERNLIRYAAKITGNADYLDLLGPDSLDTPGKGPLDALIYKKGLPSGRNLVARFLSLAGVSNQDTVLKSPKKLCYRGAVFKCNYRNQPVYVVNQLDSIPSGDIFDIAGIQIGYCHRNPPDSICSEKKDCELIYRGDYDPRKSNVH